MVRAFVYQAAMMSLFVAIDQSVRTLVNEKLKQRFRARNNSSSNSTLDG
jgi:hypothetical protein